MFARVKKSRHVEYLQIIETYRDRGTVRQRVILYVGHYASVGDALEKMPREVQSRCRGADKDEKLGYDPEGAKRSRRAADELAARLDALKRLVAEHPDLIERDRKRAERHKERQRAAQAERTAARMALGA